MRVHKSGYTVWTPMATMLGLTVVALLIRAEPAHAQVGTWDVEGRVAILACLGNECVSDSQRLSGTSTLFEDGTYRSPNLGAGCLGEVPDEVGVWRLEAHNRIVFEPTNIDDIVEAILACFPDVSFELRDYISKGKLKQGGQLMKGKAKLRALVTVSGQRVAAKATWRWKGVPALAGTVGASQTVTATPTAGVLAILVERLSRE